MREAFAEPRAGMTLVEVMIAAMLIATVIMTSMTATSQAMLAAEKNRDMGKAVDWIEAEVEYLRSLTWAQLDAMPEQSTFNQPAPEEKFLSALRIKDRNASQKIVQLTTSWNDSRGRFHETSSVTFINENGI